MENKNKNALLDLTGTSTGIEMTSKRIIAIICAVAAPLLCQFLPLAAYGEKAGLALGLVAATMILMLTHTVSVGPAGSLFCFTAVCTGLLDMGTLQTSVGNGLFFQCIGMCIVGYGIEATPFGARLTYTLLEKFGKNPKYIVVAILVATAILSSIISNFATAVLMVALIHKMLQEMGEQPGKSRFGAACMIAVVVGANTGGMGFINGSIGVNLFGIGQINAGTTGNYNITAAQWAMVGWITLIPLLIIASFVLLKSIKFEAKDVKVLETSYYKDKLTEMGRISGPEIRWLLMIGSLIVFMLLGFNTNKMMLIYIFLAVAPIVGVVSTREAFAKAVPWEIMYSMATMSMMGTVFNTSGIAKWIASLITPVLGGISPLLIMFIITGCAGLSANFIVSSTMANVSIFVGIMAPIVEAMGYNPAIILLPTIFIISFMMALPQHSTVLVSYGKGYYNASDLVKPAVLITAAGVILSCLICYFLAPVLWGVPLYL